MTNDTENLIDIWTKIKGNGRKIVLLKRMGKMPVQKGWTTKDPSDDEIRNHTEQNGNLGNLIDTNMLVLDVDVKEAVIVDGETTFPAIQSLEKLRRDTGLKLEPTVYTPSGGFHIYFRNKKELPVQNHFPKEYPGIEFFSGGRQCLIPGSRVPDPVTREERIYYLGKGQKKVFICPPQAPKALTDIIRKNGARAQLSLSEEAVQKCTGGTNFLTSVEQNEKEERLEMDKETPREFVEEVLWDIDPDIHRDQWYRVGAPLFNWNAEEGFLLFKEWSGKCKKIHKDAEYTCETVWKSFSDSLPAEHKSGMGTLITMAASKETNIWKEDRPRKISPAFRKKEVGPGKNRTPKKKLTDEEFKTCIAPILYDPDFTGETYFKEVMGPALRKYAFSDIQKDTVVSTIHGRFRELGKEFKISVSSVRALTAPFLPGVDVDPLTPEELREIFKDFVYAGAEKKFVDMKTMEFMEIPCFDTEFGSLIPRGKQAAPPAHHYLKTNSLIRTVTHTECVPGKERFMSTGGCRPALNMYNPDSHPKPAEEYTPEGLEAIRRVEEHCSVIAGKDREILLRWISHQIQHPGRIIGWMPVLISFEGIGKTYFHTLLTRLIGEKHVGVVENTGIESDFNAEWGKGHISIVLEEFGGGNSKGEEIKEKLKARITNSKIYSVRKYENGKTVSNTANMIAFTNHTVPFSLDASDRRYCILTSPFKSVEEMRKDPAYTEDYYESLFKDLDHQSAQLCKYFRERDLGDFLTVVRAPMTDGKHRIIYTCEDQKTGMSEVKDLIETGGMFYNSEYVHPHSLFNDLEMSGSVPLTLAGVKNILIRLGYTRDGTRYRLPVEQTKCRLTGDTKKYALWTRRTLTPEEFRAVRDQYKNGIKEDRSLNRYGEAVPDESTNVVPFPLDADEL